MSHLSQISRNSTHFTKLNVKTSGLIIMHQTVLWPFLEATRMMSAQKYATLGLTYFALSSIREFLEEQKTGENLLNKLKTLLLTQMDRYFENDHDRWEQMKVGC